MRVDASKNATVGLICYARYNLGFPLRTTKMHITVSLVSMTVFPLGFPLRTTKKA
jgi:hypothetical protein